MCGPGLVSRILFLRHRRASHSMIMYLRAAIARNLKRHKPGEMWRLGFGRRKLRYPKSNLHPSFGVRPCTEVRIYSLHFRLAAELPSTFQAAFRIIENPASKVLGPRPFGSGVSVGTSILADDGRYPLPCSPIPVLLADVVG